MPSSALCIRCSLSLSLPLSFALRNVFSRAARVGSRNARFVMRPTHSFFFLFFLNNFFRTRIPPDNFPVHARARCFSSFSFSHFHQAVTGDRLARRGEERLFGANGRIRRRNFFAQVQRKFGSFGRSKKAELLTSYMRL